MEISHDHSCVSGSQKCSSDILHWSRLEIGAYSYMFQWNIKLLCWKLIDTIILWESLYTLSFCGKAFTHYHSVGKPLHTIILWESLYTLSFCGKAFTHYHSVGKPLHTIILWESLYTLPFCGKAFTQNWCKISHHYSCVSSSQLPDGKLNSSNLDKAFILNGFSNWKDASVAFKNHDHSKCHRDSVRGRNSCQCSVCLYCQMFKCNNYQKYFFQHTYKIDWIYKPKLHSRCNKNASTA